MKKIIFTLFVSMLMLASCSKNPEHIDKCYRINFTMPSGKSLEQYDWISESDVDYYKALYDKAEYTNVKFTRERSYKTMFDCIANDTVRVY